MKFPFFSKKSAAQNDRNKKNLADAVDEEEAERRRRMRENSQITGHVLGDQAQLPRL